MQVYKLTKLLIMLSLATMGFGNHLLGINIFTNVSTFFIYFTLVLQILTRTLHFPRILMSIYIYIFIQTYILNLNNITLYSSIKQFFGIILFSLALFSFVSEYRYRITNIVQAYYKLVLIITGISILQLVLFVLLKISFIPQNILSGINVTGNIYFVPEMFEMFPRAVGLYTEPAHFAIMTLPGVYIALMVLQRRTSDLQIHNKFIAWFILIGFVLSFSLVGYLGLILCLLSIFAGKLKKNILSKIVIVLFFIGVFYSITQTKLISKITSLPVMFTNIENYEYTSSDLTGFALASNIAVANKGLEKSNYLGTGLNTHMDTYEEVVYSIFSNSQVIMELNNEDAASLFIRIISEFGIPGILALLIFFYHFKLGRNIGPSSLKTINGMCLVVLISYSIRNGNYLGVNFMLFSALYYYSFKLIKEDSKAQSTVQEINT